jgi:hypothetical protein
MSSSDGLALEQVNIGVPIEHANRMVVKRNAFAGWMRQLSVYGVAAAAIKIRCGLASFDHGATRRSFVNAP